MAATATCNNVWTLQSLDSAAVGRLHDNALLTQGAATPNATPRAGVIPSVMTGGNTVPLDFFVTQTSVASMGCLVGSGNAVVASASRGPYLFSNPINGVALTLATSNPTNPRIDLVYLQVVDNPPDTGTTGGVIGVVTGTPAGSPSVPPLPTNGVCIPLAQIAVAANVASITNANITDVRKSAGPEPRMLLPGDLVTDPGFMYGELRQRRGLFTVPFSTGNFLPIYTDYWGTDNAWHGMQEIPVMGVWNASGTSNITATTTESVLYNITVPDPGFAYYLRANIEVEWNAASGGAGNALAVAVHESFSLAGATRAGSVSGTGGTGFDSASACKYLKTTPGSGVNPTPIVYTGSQNFCLGATVLGTGTITCVNPNTFGTAEFSLTIVPVP